MTAEEYYQEGNAWRKQGDFKRALDCYMEAIALDPGESCRGSQGDAG